MIFLLLILFTCAAPARAEISPLERMEQSHMESRAQNLYRAVRCAVCQNQNIADSNAEIAKDMRALIRQKITDGENDADIIAYLHARYGDFILMKPPFHSGTFLLWLAPLLFLLGGSFLVFFIFKNRAGDER